MGEFNEFLTDFNFSTWLSSAVNVILMLAVAHWFPWSFVVGHKLGRYYAYLCGCVAIIFAFGLWALMEEQGTAWVWLVVIIAPLHWLLWFPSWLYSERFHPAVAYSIASLPTIAAYTFWAIGASNYIALVSLISLYVAGGIVTPLFYHFDSTGMYNFGRKNNEH